MTDDTPFLIDPDGQPPMPFPAADDYARTVMAWAQAPLPPDVAEWRGLAYGPHRLHRLDVYAPRGAHAAPVLLFWHGGGWTNGYRDYVRFMAPHVTRLGAVLVAPSYRLAPTDRLPAGFDDAVAALAHVHRHATDWGGDPQRLLLAGHSAGGHLATLLALREADRVRAGVPASALHACLPISGIMDLHHPAPPPGGMEERIYTMVLQDPLQDALYSPLSWTPGNRLRFVLNHGDRDSERVQRSNQRLLALLQTQPGAAELHIQPDTDHFQTHTRLSEGNAPWYGQLSRCLEESTHRP